MKNYNQKGFTLVLSLVLLLVMSLMGGALVVIASSDHQSNNSSDEYQQTFYVAETALMQAQKSILNQMLGPISDDGVRDYENRVVPRNVDLTPAQSNDSPAPEKTPCFESFRNLPRDDDFRVIEQVKNQSFFELIEPVYNALDDNPNNAIIYGDADDRTNERTRLENFRYEFFSVNAGTSVYKGSGGSLKKAAGKLQRQGTAFRLYGCGIFGDASNPEIIIPLETIVVLSH